MKSSRSRGSWLRYATGIGRTDWHALRECFTQDVHADYDTIGVFDGAEAITAVMEKTHTGMGPTFHRMSNVVVDVDVDGDRASAHTRPSHRDGQPDQQGDVSTRSGRTTTS